MTNVNPNTEFTFTYVQPGTPYPDEPSEEIPAGWYVFGRDPEGDPEDGPLITLSVEWAVDSEGEDISESVASATARALAELYGDPA